MVLSVIAMLRQFSRMVPKGGNIPTEQVREWPQIRANCGIMRSLFGKGAMTSDSLHYAMRALRKEILEFRFDYPLDVDPQAGPRHSLHYYL